MKKIIIIIVLLFNVIMVSCNNKKVSNISDYINDFYSWNIDNNKILPITWGYRYEGNLVEPVIKVKDILDAQLNIELDWALFENREFFYRQFFSDVENNKLPDIIYGTPVNTMAEIGGIRSIPRDMIETYAPNYANLLYQENAWPLLESKLWGFTDSIESDIAFLCPYDIKCDMLPYFSVYRLDYLESINMLPEGEIVQINNNIYFTDTPFSFDDFVRIMSTSMDQLANLGINNKMVLTGDYDYDRGNYDSMGMPSLWGMFDIGNDYIYENEKIIPTYASEAYKKTLEFIENNVKMGNITISRLPNLPISYFTSPGQHGSIWISMSIDYLLFNSPFDNLIRYEPTVKLLIIPPETNIYNISSVTRANRGVKFNTQGWQGWVIGSHVSNEKLARILTIFDKISFDPEWFVLTRYGLEGINYLWADEPYNSQVIIKRTTNRFWPPVESYIWDGNAGNYVYRYGNNKLYEYAISNAAKTTLEKKIVKFVDDLAFRLEMNEFNNIYGGDEGEITLEQIVKEYYKNILEGNQSTYESWNSYMADMEFYGLNMIIEIANRHMEIE